tara:strand:+ start:2289 stop:2525 length:237 start_codon:yes stop_codon:yes gene_type:complete
MGSPDTVWPTSSQRPSENIARGETGSVEPDAMKLRHKETGVETDQQVIPIFWQGDELEGWEHMLTNAWFSREDYEEVE